MKLLFIPPLHGGNKELDAILTKEISKDFPSEWYAITRFDSDDALANDFYSELYIKCKLHKKNNLYFVFKKGLLWNGEKCFEIEYPFNAFCTCVKEPGDPIELYSLQKGHNGVNDKQHIILNTKPMWLQTVNGINVFNNFTNVLNLSVSFREIHAPRCIFFMYGFHLPKKASSELKKTSWLAKIILCYEHIKKIRLKFIKKIIQGSDSHDNKIKTARRDL